MSHQTKLQIPEGTKVSQQTVLVQLPNSGMRILDESGFHKGFMIPIHKIKLLKDGNPGGIFTESPDVEGPKTGVHTAA